MIKNSDFGIVSLHNRLFSHNLPGKFVSYLQFGIPVLSFSNKNSEISNLISSDDVVLFMKGTPDFPQCGFSANVIGILNYFGVKFTSFNVLEDNELREGIKEFSDWPTIPQIYIKKEFIGGCDILREMAESGEIIELFKKKNLPIKINEQQ